MELLGETLGLIDGDVDGEIDALTLLDGLVDADGLVLALGLSERLTLLDGLTLADGETLGLLNVTQTCTSFEAALSPSSLPARTTRYQMPDSGRKSLSSASRALGTSMMKSSVYVPGEEPKRIRQYSTGP
jgi:hypothetical protein